MISACEKNHGIDIAEKKHNPKGRNNDYGGMTTLQQKEMVCTLWHIEDCDMKCRKNTSLFMSKILETRVFFIIKNNYIFFTKMRTNQEYND